MKHFILTISLTLSLAYPVSLFAGAATGSGCPVTDCEITQLLNNGQLLGIQGTDASQLGLQIGEKIRTYTLEPLVRVATAVALQQIQDQTLNWIRTGFKGSGPAFIVNPDAYFRNVENQSIATDLNSIQANNQNIFSDGVIGTVIRSVREGRLPTGQQINFTLSTTIQNSLCTEENITRMATQAVDEGLTTGTSNQTREQRIAQKKNELYYQLCSRTAGNEKTLQKNLVTCFANDFNCGGWNAWLDLTTNPDNTPYGQEVKTSAIVAQNADNAKQKDEKQRVNGLAPLIKCTDLVTFDQDGNTLPEDAQGCLNEEVVTPAAAIADALSNVQSGSTILASSIKEVGLGPLAGAILQGAFARIQSGLASSGGSGLNSSQTTSLVVDSNGRVRTTLNNGGTQTGANGQPSYTGTSLTDSVVGNVVDDLRNNLVSLQTTQKNLSNSYSLFALYERDLNTLQSCYTSNQTNSNIDTNGGLAYIANARKSYVSYYDQVKKDVDAVQNMLVLVNGYIVTLQNDQSQATVAKITSNYSANLRKGTIFNEAKQISTENEYKQYKKQVDDDRTNNLTPKLQQCQSSQNQQTKPFDQYNGGGA